MTQFLAAVFVALLIALIYQLFFSATKRAVIASAGTGGPLHPVNDPPDDPSRGIFLVNSASQCFDWLPEDLIEKKKGANCPLHGEAMHYIIVLTVGDSHFGFATSSKHSVLGELFIIACERCCSEALTLDEQNYGWHRSPKKEAKDYPVFGSAHVFPLLTGLRWANIRCSMFAIPGSEGEITARNMLNEPTLQRRKCGIVALRHCKSEKNIQLMRALLNDPMESETYPGLYPMRTEARCTLEHWHIKP